MTTTLRSTVLAVAILFTGPWSAAQAQDSTLQDAQREAVEGIGKLLEALQMFVKSVPQYSAPEVLPNGDIIIRRVNPEKAPPTPSGPERDDDSTST